MSFKDRWRAVRDWSSRAWTDIRPGPETRKGTVWGAVAVALFIALSGGAYMKFGFGRAVDFGFAFLVTAIGLPLFMLGVVLILKLFAKLPRWETGIVLGALALVMLLFSPDLGAAFGGVLLLTECVLGATIATFLFGGFADLHRARKIITVVLFVAAIAANVALGVFLFGTGTDKEKLRIEQVSSPDPQPVIASDPAKPGPGTVLTTYYGVGTDQRRVEYGKSVAIKTKTVDASLFIKDFKGWKEKVRRFYWGFGFDKLPLNGRIWYPQGNGPFPLVLIVHGNHNMAEFSDPGYEYLGKLLASRGFVLASVDENFLNGWIVGPEKEQAVRGWMLLEHLKLFREWNATPGSPFYKKIDVENVALMGHSRGGEAVATAALFNTLAYYPDDANITFDYHYPIKALVAIAPVDGQYKPAGEYRYIKDVNYFTLQGANDSDVSSFNGSRQFDHVRFSGDGHFFKAELYIYGANHGQFNTVWGRYDTGMPFGWFLNTKPLLAPEAQRQIAEVYLSAFLETTLHGRREYLPMFRDYRQARQWLPKTYYMSRYLDSSYQPVALFNEDSDLTTATLPGALIAASNLSIWKEARIPYRQGDRGYNGVFLGWNREKNAPVPEYSITLPEGFSARPVLTLSLAATSEEAPLPGKHKDDEKKKDAKKKDEKPEPTSFGIELEASDGTRQEIPLRQFGALLPPFTVQFTKLKLIDDKAYEKASEPVFQTFEIPLSAFPKIDASKLRVVRLKFDETPMRVMILSQMGFENK